MVLYLDYVKKRCKKFSSFDIDQIPRDLNTQADALASLGSNFSPAVFDKIPIVHLLELTIERPDQTCPIHEDTNSWTKPYYDWFLKGTLPNDKNEARALKIKAFTYTIINNMLFKKSQAGPYLRCLEPHEAKKVIEDIHGGYCGNHKGGRSLGSKVLRTDYFWPTLRADCIAYNSKFTQFVGKRTAAFWAQWNINLAKPPSPWSMAVKQ
ncbi:uncharacterized protein LOC141641654 [Silene latifolia]|uniref:uncharacterized protein LOC141641654 n=1 Tax=Silene latifolia TaxID=37657 RepID=UPI003D76BEE6